MDHVPVPRNPTLRYPRVPLLCKTSTEDVDFMGYPKINGWQKLVPVRGMDFTFIDKITDPDEICRLEALLQGWIFFGLLREALGPLDLFNIDDYLGSDDQGETVHSKGLIDTFAKISPIMEIWSAERKIRLGDRLEQCMRFVYGVLVGLVRIEIHDRIDHGIWMSVLSVCETVAGMCDIHLERSPESLSQTVHWTSSEGLPLPGPFSLANLVGLGWCRSEATLCESTFASIHGRMYIRSLTRTNLGVSHSDCNADICEKMQINEATYRTRHVHEQCECESIGPNRAEVATCLRDGTFPLLRIHGSTLYNVSVEVVPFRGHEPYVALSHVWADGLGNPTDTVLPCCQVVALWQLVQSISGCTFTRGVEDSDTLEQRKELRELFLWCDTLCCPTVPPKAAISDQTELKTIAISRLKSVYDSAEYVLVLDQTIQNTHSMSIDPLEQAVRVLTSRWIRRLWTFQEAALAKKLLLAFADRLVDFRELWQHVSDLYKTSPAHNVFCRSLTYQCVTLRSWHRTASGGGSLLNRLKAAVGHRRVSIPSDEAICLATALELDVKKVSKTEEGSRMEAVWKLMFESNEGVPDDIVYNEYSRLSTIGFRWAPSTFQSAYSSRQPVMTRGQSTSKALWTAHGIKIQRPGWQIEVDWPHVGAEAMEQQWARQHHDSFQIRHPDGNWFAVQGVDTPNGVRIESLMGLLQIGRTMKLFAILDKEVNSQQGQRALLVALEDLPEERVYRSICLLQVARLIPFIETFHELGYEYSEMMKCRYPRKGCASMVAVQRAVRMLGAWLPAGHEKVSQSSVQNMIARQQEMYSSEMTSLLEEYGQMAAKTPKAQEAILEARQRANSDALKAYVFRSYYNGHAKVTKVFDTSHVWCVD